MQTTKYPIGIQNFEDLRKGNWLYIDKTDLIFDLVNSGKYYFLSRPRRFGKSLLISTLEAYFQGKKDLFNGLAIESLSTEWKRYPVLHLDLNAEDYTQEGSLENSLVTFIDQQESIYGISSANASLSKRFELLVSNICEKTGEQVVILIDEYDKPLLMNANDSARQDKLRNILKAFFGVLKSRDADIRFALLTGVTKFSKVSVFSDLNNLEDITLSNRFSTICGITQIELENNFSEGIKIMTENYGISKHECLEMLKDNYDGYHFSSSLNDVYNPFSLLNALKNGEIGSYWFKTGTPTFLAKMIRRDGFSLSELEREKIASTRMQTMDLISEDPLPILFQSGYLTIKNFDPRLRRYELGYPNREVKEGFLNFLIPYYTPRFGNRSAFDIGKFLNDVESGHPDDFMKRLSALFSDFPYDHISDCERHYHNVVYLTMTLLGFYVRSEYRTSDGRCDAVVKTDRFIYIFEFKYNSSARAALNQIKEKNYKAPFTADSRKIITIGVNFSSETRNINDYIIE